LNFEQIVGQSFLVENMKNSFQKGRIVHAYLLRGPKGSGKRTFAAEIARALNCKSTGDKPCDACSSCLKTLSGNHPDIKRIGIRPDKTRIIIEQIRELQSDIQIKPYEGNYKVYIIENANEMTVDAQNCLLKTLEEPPPYGVIFLLADSAEGLLPTIESRCQIIRLKRVGVEDITRVLRKRCGLPEEKARLIASLSDGLVGRALELAEHKEFMEQRQQLFYEINEIIRTGTLGVFNHMDFFLNKKQELPDMLDLCELWFRDMLVWKETGNMELVVNRDFLELLECHTKLFTCSSIQDIIEMISLTKKRLRGYTNAQMSIENLLLYIVEVKDACQS